MPSNYPTSDDNFTEPSSPGSTALSSAGSGSRSHTQHHRDLGDAIEAIEANVAILTHDHSNTEARPTGKLLQANTHQTPDTDGSTSALHHTLGTGANQAAAGNHTHTQATSHSSPDTDSATTSLHHTLGTGANQAAAGNHTHTQSTSHSSPDTDLATTSLHHTLGTGANQAAAGDHTHTGLDETISFTASQSNSSSVNTTETAVLTHGSSIDLAANTAYRVEFSGRVWNDNFDLSYIRLRKNNASGTLIVEVLMGNPSLSSSSWVNNQYVEVYIRNNTGSTVSFTPCMTLDAVSGNSMITANSTSPRYMRISYAGPSSSYSNAVSVT